MESRLKVGKTMAHPRGVALRQHVQARALLGVPFPRTLQKAEKDKLRHVLCLVTNTEMKNVIVAVTITTEDQEEVLFMAVANEILKKIHAAFEHEPRINLHRYPVDLGFSDGELTLTGEVENIAAKKLALEFAAAVPGVSGIIDRLRVASAQPMGDGAIRDHVRDALLQEPTLGDCTLRVLDKNEVKTIRDSTQASSAIIEVSVADGVVTLNGQAPSLALKRVAGVLAWWVPGSRDVVNGLEVVPPEDDSDDDITDVVRLILEKNPFVNATQIHVRTQNSVVTLEGLVTNETEKELAEFDAWYVFGVDKVVNKLVVQE